MTDQLPPVPTAADGDSKIWAVAAHLSWFVGLPFILPLIIYLVKRDESAYAAENAREALNFHITLILYFILCIILLFFLIGFFLAIILGLVAFILSIIAAVRAAEGYVYRYPMTLRLV